MEVIRHLFWLLVFPGFLFTIAVGLYACWVVRKVTALIHHRIGPPVLQPLYDVLKLLGKETLIPEAANKAVFIWRTPFDALTENITCSHCGESLSAKWHYCPWCGQKP